MPLLGVSELNRFGLLLAVLEPLLGVFAREAGIDLEVFPWIGGRLRAVGEFDRVDVGLEEPEGLLSLRTETGNLDAVEDDPRSMWSLGRATLGACDCDGPGLAPATSLCDRWWALAELRFFASGSS